MPCTTVGHDRHGSKPPRCPHNAGAYELCTWPVPEGGRGGARLHIGRHWAEAYVRDMLACWLHAIGRIAGLTGIMPKRAFVALRTAGRAFHAIHCRTRRLEVVGVGRTDAAHCQTQPS